MELLARWEPSELLQKQKNKVLKFGFSSSEALSEV